MREEKGKYSRFKVWMQDHGILQKDLAKLLDISVTSAHNKLNGKSNFYLNEVRYIQEQWGVDINIFLR